MIYVIVPEYGYDERREVEEFETIEEALESINSRLKGHAGKGGFKIGVEDYMVIKGEEIKLKIAEFISKVMVDK